MAETSAHRDRIRLKSFDPKDDRWFTVSVADKTCDCLHFLLKGRCEHLSAIGLHPLKPFVPSTHPTFSQALSGLVKSIRIRRLDDAVYWLVYLDTFPDAQHRFRTARRLLIGSAEDGLSVAVMEKVAAIFWRLSKPQADLADLVAEAIRICKVKNWWHPHSGGPEYIYNSLIGERAWLYRDRDCGVSALQDEIRKVSGAV